MVNCDVLSRWISGKCAFWFVCFFAFSGSLEAQETMSGLATWDANPESNIAGYFLYYGQQPRQYGTKVNAGNVTSLAVSNLTRGTTYYFALTAYNTRGVESDLSAEVVYAVPAQPSNAPPTLDPISNLTIAEDTGAQTILLTGINAGATNESQALTVSATSSNPSVISSLGVYYTSPNPSGTLQLQPVANAWGSSVITVTVDDGQPENHSVTRNFTVTVSPVNDPPRFNPIADLVLPEDTASMTVPITGIDSGAPNESQALMISAVSSRPDIVPDPSISYTSPATSGSLTLAPVTNATGSATITVTLSDGQAQNGTFTRTFAVTVQSGNDPPTISQIPDQVIPKNRKSGPISFKVGDTETDPAQLQVTVESSAPSVIPVSGIAIAGLGADRTLSIDPTNGQTGDAIVTISVSDGQSWTTTSFSVSVRNTV